jgi:hypothetical protein
MVSAKRVHMKQARRKTPKTAVSLAARLLSVHYAASVSTIRGSTSPSPASSVWATTSSPRPRRNLTSKESGRDSGRQASGFQNLDLETLRALGISDLDYGEEGSQGGVQPDEAEYIDSDSFVQPLFEGGAGDDVDALLDALQEEQSDGWSNPKSQFGDGLKTRARNELGEDIADETLFGNEGTRVEAEEDGALFDISNMISNLESDEDEEDNFNETDDETEQPYSSGPGELDDLKENLATEAVTQGGSKFKSSASDDTVPRIDLDRLRGPMPGLAEKSAPHLGRVKQLTRKLVQGGKNKKRGVMVSPTRLLARPGRPKAKSCRGLLSRVPPSAPLAFSTFPAFHFPMMKIVAGFAGAQILWNWAKSLVASVTRQRNPERVVAGNEGEQTTVDELQGEEEIDGELDEEELKALERLGLGPSRFARTPRRTESVSERASNSMQSEATSTPTDGRVSGTEGHRTLQRRPKGPRMLVNVLGMKKKNGPTQQEMEQEVFSLTRRAEAAERDVETLNSQLSDCMQNLEQSRGQCNRLQGTNRYLKSQVDSYQVEMEETLKRERQKATEELARIREAMVEVLDRERKLMRDHMLSASEEVRAAVLRAEEDSTMHRSHGTTNNDGLAT